jgi:hypothetical protein
VSSLCKCISVGYITTPPPQKPSIICYIHAKFKFLQADDSESLFSRCIGRVGRLLWRSVDPESDDPRFHVNLYTLNERLDKTCMYVYRVVSFAFVKVVMSVCMPVRPFFSLYIILSSSRVSTKYGKSNSGVVYILEHNVLSYTVT